MARESKSAKIRTLLDKGLKSKDIVKKLKVSPQLVYIVSRNYGKKPTVKRGKPSKANERAVLAQLWAILDAYRKAA
jgi:hypothetical protein